MLYKWHICRSLQDRDHQWDSRSAFQAFIATFKEEVIRQSFEVFDKQTNLMFNQAWILRYSFEHRDNWYSHDKKPRNQDNRLIHLMNKIAFSYIASWLQWLQLWLIHEISSKWASPFSFRNTWMFWVKPKHDNYSCSYCYESLVIVIKLLLYLLDFEIGKNRIPMPFASWSRHRF